MSVGNRVIQFSVSFMTLCWKIKIMPVSVVNRLPVVRQVDCIGEDSAGKTGFQVGAKYFIMSLKLAGLHHLTWDENNGHKIRRKLEMFYRGLIPGVLVVNLLYSLGEFINAAGFDSMLLNNLISSIWFLQVSLYSLNNAPRGWRWNRFYDAWNIYADENVIDTPRLIGRLSLVTTCSYFLWLLVASAFMGISLATPAPPTGFMLYIPLDLVMFILVLRVMTYFYFVTTWFLLTSQFMLICVSLCKLFHGLYERIQRSIGVHEAMNDKVERFRHQHDQICHMVNLADDMLSVFIMVTVFTTIPLIVLTLYFVLFVSEEAATFSYAATWWSISLSTLQLAAVFLLGGAVNHMAHKPSVLLYRLNLGNMAQHAVTQLGVFLNRLTSQPIGMTAFGLFVLDKPTIITFVGSIATYAIVMIQFKPGETSYTCSCNCTGQ